MIGIARYWRSKTSQNLRRAIVRGHFIEASQWITHGWRIFRSGWQEGLPALITRNIPGSDDKKRRAEAQTHLKRARYLLSKWQLLEALQSANRSIGLLQANGGAHQVNTLALELLGDIEGAKAAALETYKSDPLNPKSLRLLCKYELDDAYKAALASIMPHVVKRKWTKNAVINARDCLLDAADGDAALSLMSRAGELNVFPDQDEFLSFQADLLRRLRRFEEAVPLYTTLAEKPTRRYAALVARAECKLELGDFEQAEADAALAAEIRLGIGPRGFSNTLFHTRFRKGHCRDAFMESRHRPFTRGLFEDIDGNYVQVLDDLRGQKNVFVLADYGVGDEIRFASIYPELSRHLKKVTLSCDPRLETLFSRSFPKLKFVAVPRWREETIIRDPSTRIGLKSQRLSPHVSTLAQQEMEKADAFTSIFDLLAEMRPAHADFDRKPGYLKPDPAMVTLWRAKVKQGGRPGRPNIALSWRSLLQGTVRNVHYLAASDLAPLAELDATFWLFQARVDENETTILRRILPHVRVLEGLDLLDDFEGQSAFLTAMDAVISPCTTVGELAGALGRPTVMFGRVESARCRLRSDGSDIWHKSMRAVVPPPGSDAAKTVEMLISELRQHPRLKIQA